MHQNASVRKIMFVLILQMTKIRFQNSKHELIRSKYFASHCWHLAFCTYAVGNHLGFEPATARGPPFGGPVGLPCWRTALCCTVCHLTSVSCFYIAVVFWDSLSLDLLFPQSLCFWSEPGPVERGGPWTVGWMLAGEVAVASVQGHCT